MIFTREMGREVSRMRQKSTPAVPTTVLTINGIGPMTEASWRNHPNASSMIEELERRLVAYCAIDTPSDPDTPADQIPSTACQWDLLRLLRSELEEMGAQGVTLTERGYLIATVPGRKKAPVVALCAHVDTSAQFNATGVKPRVHRQWNGQPIRLGEHVLDPGDSPYLASRKGHDIVTASGNSLLGADDKAGVAIAMTAARRLLEDNPGGDVRVCFSPDEEIGRGALELPLDVLKADVAYTLDACEVGELCYETFSADKAVITVTGVSIHPGFATGKLVNALHTAADILNALPRDLTPEGTSGRQGFLHATDLKGSAHLCTLSFILRAFELGELQSHRELLRKACSLPTKCRVDLEFVEQYRNMRETLQKDMRPVDLAVEAYRRCGIEPRFIAFRGGTDGSILTARGLPTPNLFCGMQNFHGPLEWVSLQDMEQAVQVCLQLVSLWGKQPAAAPGPHPHAS